MGITTKTQQVWFIKLMGSNVNLGNIAFNEVIPLECLRLGLRGDTFFDHFQNSVSKMTVQELKRLIDGNEDITLLTSEKLMNLRMVLFVSKHSTSTIFE